MHTDDPGRALSLGTARGAIGGIEIANMHAQTHQREERLLHAVPESEPAACAVVVVTAGGGNRALAESFGAEVVDGGSTMNPSTSDLLAAIDRAKAAEVVVLPNNGNVIMTRGAGGGKRSKGGPCRPDAVDPGGARSARDVRSDADGRRERGGDGGDARRASSRARSRSRAATCS